MLSAWFDRVDLYLAKGVAVVKTLAHPCEVVHLPSTLTWANALARVSQALPPKRGKGLAQPALHVMLSGALIPPIAIQAPADASSWSDLGKLLPAFASEALGVPQTVLRCAQEVGGNSIGAAGSESLVLALASWAAQSNMRLRQVRPAWSIASHAALARSKTCRALQLVEPDGTTLLHDDNGSWSCAHLTDRTAASVNLTATARRQFMAWGVALDEVLNLEFVTQPSQPLRHGPKPWPGHWRLCEASAG